MRILVVDDSATMRRILRNNLKAMGYDSVVEAENGQAALDRLASDGVQFVIADRTMPVMDGLELVRRIRATGSHAKLPVLIVTAISEADEIVKAIAADIDGYIVKPFEPATLKAKIDEILHGARTR